MALSHFCVQYKYTGIRTDLVSAILFFTLFSGKRKNCNQDNASHPEKESLPDG